jgi:hypothetical protein
MQGRAGGEGDSEDDAKLPERGADLHDLLSPFDTVEVHGSSPGSISATQSIVFPGPHQLESELHLPGVLGVTGWNFVLLIKPNVPDPTVRCG